MHSAGWKDTTEAETKAWFGLCKTSAGTGWCRLQWQILSREAKYN